MEVILGGSFIYPLHALSLSSNYWDHDTGKEPGCYRSRHRWETCSSSPTQLVSEGQNHNCHPSWRVELPWTQTRFSCSPDWLGHIFWHWKLGIAGRLRQQSWGHIFWPCKRIWFWHAAVSPLSVKPWVINAIFHTVTAKYPFHVAVSAHVLAPFTQEPQRTTPTHPFSPGKSK